MDIKLEKKKGLKAVFQKKNLPYAFAGLLVVFIAWLLLRDNSSTLRVNSETVVPALAERGEFND